MSDDLLKFPPFGETQHPATERSSLGRPSLRADVEALATEVNALRDLFERTVLPALSQGGMPGQFPPGLGQQLMPTGPMVQHIARRVILHGINGEQVTLGGMEQHDVFDPLTNSRTSEITTHRYMSRDNRTMNERAEVYACTSCHRFPLVSPHFCATCRDGLCSNCIITYQGGVYCSHDDPRPKPTLWELIFG
jgi:hypothetical protein